MASARCLLHLVVVVLIAAAAAEAADLASDRAALLALRDAVGRHLPWDPSAPTPCGGAWRGVGCSPAGDRVTELRLPGKSLSREIPVGTVGNLTALQTLSLRQNAISGGIPVDIGGCVQLRSLNLSGNRLTGELPEGLFSLALLEKVDLSRNRLAGGVSPEFSRLANMITLNLDRNDFNGTLPANLTLPSLKQLNVSYNDQLGGAVPASLAGMPASAFLGTALCGGPLAPCANPAPPPSPPPSSSKGGKLSRGAIVGIILAAVAVLIVVLTVGFLMCFRRRATAARSSTTEAAAPDVHEGTEPITVTVARTDRDAAVKRSHTPTAAAAAMMTGEGNKLVFLGSAPERPYDLDTLLRASAEVIGKGGTGTTYRATLDGGEPTLAVKRLREVHLSEREFRDRVAALGALRHDNLPRLIAYFYSGEEKLLVYDFVGTGSLASLLHGGGARLDFAARARIALAVARGVAFIHGGGARSSHGDIKSSNVVVTAARDGAYVTDYGLAQLVGGAAAAPQPKRGAGYRAPEVVDARGLSKSADVYSFGVLLLELLSGRPPLDALPDGAGAGEGVDLPRWMRSVVQEEWTSEVFDAAIASEPHVEGEMMRLLQLGMECTEHHPDRRPAMAEVEARIERIVEDTCRKADFSSTDGSRSASA
ncbi:probable inactive receptor kinase RLK902 [Oryza brachyantha]|uniref:probable inactive receptor kinase RLK902 n=1 Tax=Oryza brachyantha TaxID=4533 RepID=UPI001ADA630D|nr:probable inactive receptor kinase RLK902 [Oryza brachyantha]